MSEPFLTTERPAPSTVGELRATGEVARSVHVEIRDNLLSALAAGRDPWPGLHGFASSVIPQLERALLAGHDVVLLGERGQGKTRLLRSLVGLLDEWSPVLAGSELGEHPFEPITVESRRRAAELSDALPVDWRHRSERYAEKLATPDTSVDVLVVASANPEDYTNRGRIITPLKDRFGAEIRTHYPRDLSDEVAVIRQEARLVATVPEALVEIVARFTRALRTSPAVDQRSGVSARFAIAATETVAAAALHRATARGEAQAVARIVDLDAALDVLRGKVEFESGEEGREREVLSHLLRTATAETVRHHLGGIDLGLLVGAIEDGALVTTGERVTARELLDGLPVLGESALYDEVCDRVGASTDGERASAVELALEGLYLARRIAKDSADGETVYG